MTYSFDVYGHMKSKLYHFYKNSPNVLGVIKMLSVPIQDRINVCDYILGQTDIDTKEGVALDQVGTKIGTRRPLAQEPENHLFTLFDEDDLELDDIDYMCMGEEGEPELGGFFVDENGLDTDDGVMMDDAGYRVLLKQKAALFRSKMTDINLYKYMLVYGAPSHIDSESLLHVKIQPESDGDLTQWERWYIRNKGFKPVGVRVELQNMNGALTI